ncbi:MAG: SixA phosphatase family protein [Actinomycetes bacterium]
MTEAARRLVVLVRHAKAESGEDRDDHDRRLTSRGRRNAAAAGRWLAERLPELDAVWCSSAVRAVQTWDGMAPAVRAPEPTVDRNLYLAGARDVVERLTDASGRAVVMVGHNPTVEQVLAALSGEMRGMRTCAIAIVDPDSRRLVDFWEPPR